MCAVRGCADLTVSDDGMSVERHHDVTTVLCNQTGERWHVLCRDGQWFGAPLTNCSSRREYIIIIITVIVDRLAKLQLGAIHELRKTLCLPNFVVEASSSDNFRRLLNQVDLSESVMLQ